MTVAASDSSTGETQEFLDRVFDRAVRLIEEGHTPIVDELLGGQESLRADVERLVRVASQIANGPIRRMPVVGGYEVLHELGHGGMGTVYLARQESLGGRPVALKVLPVSAGLSPRARDRFTFEARAIARLRHPHIVAIHDVIEEGGFCAYAMEWVDGASLAAWIDEREHGRELEAFPRLDVAAICRLGVSIARALAVVHKTGILHRDVKPSNILLRRDGTALLADFGLAREVDSSIHTQEGRFAGTVAYAPPEQLRGDSARVDARSDIYALGVTMYHALALRLPFDAREPVAMLRQIESGLTTPLRKLNPRVPRDLETIITKAIDPEPARRYQTAQEFAEDLERLLGFQPIQARRAGVTARAFKLLRRNRAAAIGLTIGSLFTILIAAGLVTYFFFVPGWVAGHVRDARLALLEPNQANSIVSVLYWGRDRPIVPTEQNSRKKAFDIALASYGKALRWSPSDRGIRREREVVQLACDQDTSQHSDGSRFPDPRDRGLFAFLTNDLDTAIKSWEQYEQQRDPLAQPDPLVDSALGVLYLFNDQHARAYPRLQQAVIAFPGVGFLLEYLADAAAKCGDAERAQQWLNEAKRYSSADPHGAQHRVWACILAATGRDDEAEALFRNAPPNTPAGIEYARFLEARGRLPEALNCYAASARAMPGERVQRLFVDAADDWWSSVPPNERLRRLRAILDKPFDIPGSPLPLLRQYQISAAILTGSPSPHHSPWSLRRGVLFTPPSLRLFVTSSLFVTLAEAFSSPSLQSLSLSELAERMEVHDMALWNRISAYPKALKEFQVAAWRWCGVRPLAHVFGVALAVIGANTTDSAQGQCATPPCFLGLGDLPGGSIYSRGLQISADGSTVVGDSKSANSTNEFFGEPYRWRADTGMVGLGDLPGQDHGGPAYGVSADGAIVTGWSSSAASCVGGGSAFEEGFRWTEAGGITGLGVGEPGCCESYGYGMADDGTVCGAIKIPGCIFAMAIATNGNGLTSITSTPSNCYGISRNGQWLIGEANGVAARWSSGTGLETLNGLLGGSFAFGVSNDGAVVGRNGSTAFLWTQAGGVTDLGDLPGGGLSSLARKITAGGSLIVGDGNSNAGQEAVIWDESRTIHRLADFLMANGVTIPVGWTLQAATGITINGNVVSICGIGINPQANTEAWIARYSQGPACDPPQVTQNPQNANPAPGATANLTVVASGTAPLSYQWRKNTVNLNNGASGCSSTISGANTATLTITNVSTTDNATYDCVVTNACGSDTSDPATLTVPAGPACAGDMDGNNVVNGADIGPFVAKLLAGGSCS